MSQRRPARELQQPPAAERRQRRGRRKLVVRRDVDGADAAILVEHFERRDVHALAIDRHWNGIELQQAK